MAQDPFPQTSDPTTEQRFQAVFSSLSRIDSLPSDPITPKDGQIWINKNAGKVRLFINGVVRTLRLED